MFIREVKKKRPNSKNIFYQYSLVQSTRVDGKSRQSNILYLGSDPILQDKNSRKIVTTILKSKIQKSSILFDDFETELINLAESYYQKYLIRYNITNQQDALNVSHSLPPEVEHADFQDVDIKSLNIAQVKSFGSENLCKQIIELLDLPSCLDKLGFSDKMIKKACLSIAARAIFASSEHKTAQILEMNSELKELFCIEKKITHKQLYTVADKLYANKEMINNHIFEKVTDLFNLDNKLVIFDISNTYFETSKRQSEIAKYGRSKEKRYDCPLVVFTGVINAEGFIRYSRIYEGNKPDSETLKDMIDDLKKNLSKNEEPTIVLDAGIATEDNLSMIEEQKLNYVCVSRKRLKEYPIDTNSKKVIQLTDRDNQKVELSIFKHPDHTDNWMCVQSEQKRVKEQSMSNKLHERYILELEQANASLGKKGGTKAIDKVHIKMGRSQEKHKRVSGQYHIEITKKENKATNIIWTKKEIKKGKSDKENGVYFIRTNRAIDKESELWSIYNCIREAESTFRCLKTDLKIRPIEHQNDYRIKSHINLTILAYQLVNTIRHLLKSKGITHDWNNILRIMNTQTIQNIKLSTKTKDIHLRLASSPIKEVKEIYQATNCKNTIPRKRKYVVYH